MAAVLAWIGAERASPLDEARWHAALARMAHRGRAGHRSLQRPGFAVAVFSAGTPSERLAGEQPRLLGASEDGAGVQIGVLDGWLIETAELGRALGRTDSDGHGALWLAAFARQRGDGLARVRGHYAGLVFDAAHHELWLQRDPGGARTLYWRADAAGCWIASDEYALVQGAADSALDPAMLPRYFAARAPLRGQGWFRDVRELPPGEQWCLDGRRSRLHRRVDLPGTHWARRESEQIAQWAAALNTAVARAVTGVRERCALSLSSGLDSQAVGALLQRQGRDFSTHSWHLPTHPQSDEGAAIVAFCTQLNLPHQHFDGSALGPLTPDTQRRWMGGELLANLYRELKQTLYAQVHAQGGRLLLNGDSGDHLYGDPGDWFVDSLKRGRWMNVLAEAGWRIRHGKQPLHRDPAVRRCLGRLLRRKTVPLAPAEFLPAARETLLQQHSAEPSDPRLRLLTGDYTTRAIAAEHAQAESLGLELRSPWRDPDVLALAAEMPSALAARRGVQKWITRQALAGVLPESSRVRPKSGDLTGFLRQTLLGPAQLRWRALLGRPQARWPEFIARAPLFDALDRPDQVPESVLLRLWLCVAFEAWREALGA